MGNSIDIHYTWVGPPDTSVDNRDVAGPIKMRLKLGTGGKVSYQVYFWCLDAHVAAFQRKFAARGAKGITVRGMESFLKTAEGTVYRLWYWYGARETRMVDRVKPIIAAAAATGSSVRERVNAKNVWGFFTLYTWGGYHFDTGIEPSDTRPLVLPVLEAFKAPAATEGGMLPFHATHTGLASLGGACLAMLGTSKLLDDMPNDLELVPGNKETVPHLDVWALGSKRYDEQVANALHCYTALWVKLEAIRVRDGANSDTYKATCRSAIMDSLYSALLHGDKGACLDDIPSANRWSAGEHLEDGRIDELGILKKYYGSHR